MASNICRKRLMIELTNITKTPVEHITTIPHEKNILDWHYVIEGPEGSPYEGGYYHGILKFPKEYPFKPPSIMMFTENGRFKTNTRLCLSMSDYHPETWNPMWSVSSILSGLLSFMLDSANTLGSIETSEAKRRQLASRSLEENMKNNDFRQLFPQYVELYKKLKENPTHEDASKGKTTAGLETSAASANREETSHVYVFLVVILVAILAQYTLFASE